MAITRASLSSTRRAYTQRQMTATRVPTTSTQPKPAIISTPQPNEGILSIGGAIVGGIAGAVTGGPGGALAGARAGYGIGSSLEGGGSQTQQVAGGSPAVPGLVATTPGGCPAGSIGFPPFCVDLRPGGAGSGSGVLVSPGDPRTSAMMAAGGVVPESRTRTQLRCPRGMVLGIDDLCYRRGSLRKDQRKWVPGRKPLLTGGDLNAISKAARAASRLKTQQKRLEKLGLLKKPQRRSRRGPTRSHSMRSLTPGVTVIDTE